MTWVEKWKACCDTKSWNFILAIFYDIFFTWFLLSITITIVIVIVMAAIIVLFSFVQCSNLYLQVGAFAFQAFSSDLYSKTCGSWKVLTKFWLVENLLYLRCTSTQAFFFVYFYFIFYPFSPTELSDSFRFRNNQPWNSVPPQQVHRKI